MKRLSLAIALVLGVPLLASACGSSDDTKSGAEPDGRQSAAAVEPQGDPHPRVQGRWRVVYTPRQGNAGHDRATWVMTPICEAGACSFRAKSSSGSKFRFRFDETIGDYTGELTYREDCLNQTNEVIAKGAYEIHAQMTLQVLRSVTAREGQKRASEMYGESIERTALTPAGETAGCRTYTRPQTEDMQIVRIDPPAGEAVSEVGVDE